MALVVIPWHGKLTNRVVGDARCTECINAGQRMSEFTKEVVFVGLGFLLEGLFLLTESGIHVRKQNGMRSVL